MKRRYVLLGLASVLVLSMSLPAIGATPDGLAKRALALAKKADKKPAAKAKKAS